MEFRLSSTRTPALLVVAFLVVQQLAFILDVSANPDQRVSFVSTDIVISQVYGGGGNSGASYRNDYIELFNRGASPVNVSGWSVQYASSANNFSLKTDLTGTIQPGGYFLIQQASGGANGTLLPSPDIATGSINMSATAGKVALVTNGTLLTCGAAATPCTLASPIRDYVGFGAAASTYEGSGPTSSPSATNAIFRSGGGCADTDDNATDFAVAAALPRNGASPASTCGTSTNPSGVGMANPSTVASGSNTLLTVSVTPGANPTSSGLSVTANLSNIGGSSSQSFFDNGTNGDVTPADNVFSFQATVTIGTSDGSYSLPFTVADAQARSSSSSIGITVGTAPPNVHLTMGNPSNAVVDSQIPGNYLMVKPQYVMAYNRDRGQPNWVSWHLDSSWIGSTPRQDDYRPDTSLPAGWYQVQATDFSGSGFDRGHHTPSGDRTASVADNSATFLMTNMMPQAPDNNQGPWEAFESYCRTLVTQGNELYIVMGGVGQGGTGSNGFLATTANGNVVVPSYTWKVAIILPSGTNDVSRVTTSTRTIGIIMPNRQGIISDPWQKYLSTIDQVEAITGYDFFSNVPVATQTVIESSLDSASNTAPQSVAAGTFTNLAIDGPNTTLTGNVTVNGVLTLGGSTLTTGANKITLGPNATVSRISGMVNGQFEKSFLDLNNPNFAYPVGTAPFQYSPVTVNLTALGTPGSTLTVSPHNSAHPNAPNQNTALRRYWTLTETGDLAARLTFKYVDADVPATVTDESVYSLQRYSGGFSTIFAAHDTVANTVTTTNSIGDFSDWTLFPLAPTAANVAVSGRVLAANNSGVSGALVTIQDLTGQTLLTARTNQFGYFNISDVPVGDSYILQIKRKGLVFSPVLVSVHDDITDLVISADTSVNAIDLQTH